MGVSAESLTVNCADSIEGVAMQHMRSCLQSFERSLMVEKPSIVLLIHISIEMLLLLVQNMLKENIHWFEFTQQPVGKLYGYESSCCVNCC